MPSELKQEPFHPSELISLAAAARRFPGNPAPSTLWRWYSKGVCGVRLWTCSVGGRRYTSEAAIQNFIAESTVANQTTVEEPSDTRSAKIEQQLRVAGVL